MARPSCRLGRVKESVGSGSNDLADREGWLSASVIAGAPNLAEAQKLARWSDDEQTDKKDGELKATGTCTTSKVAFCL